MEELLDGIESYFLPLNPPSDFDEIDQRLFLDFHQDLATDEEDGEPFTVCIYFKDFLSVSCVCIYFHNALLVQVLQFADNIFLGNSQIVKIVELYTDGPEGEKFSRKNIITSPSKCDH